MSEETCLTFSTLCHHYLGAEALRAWLVAERREACERFDLILRPRPKGFEHAHLELKMKPFAADLTSLG